MLPAVHPPADALSNTTLPLQPAAPASAHTDAPRRRPLRRRLFWLAISAMLPLIVIAGVGMAILLQQQRQQAETASLDFTRAFANAVEVELGRSVAVLAALTASPLIEHGDLAGYRALLVRVLATLPDWRAVALADADGRILVHTAYERAAEAPALVEPASFARTVAERRPMVGSLAQGPNGHWGIPVRFPLLQQGEVRYVLSGVLRPEAVLDVVRRQRVPDDWVVAVFDAHQGRIARSREHDAMVGRAPSPSLRQLLAGGASEGTGMTHTLEGDRVFTAYVRLPDSGWVIAAGLPSRALVAAQWRALGLYGGAVALSVLIAMALAWRFAKRITRPIGELRRAARALGRGELPVAPRTDIAEVHEVAETLIDAARERRRSEAEREALLGQAESASRAKDEFLAMLGHELRNPLAPILTSLQLMKLREPDRAVRERGVIERQVAHMARLVDDLLDVSRITQGKVQLERRRLDLREVLAKAAELTGPAFAERAPLVLALPDVPVVVDGDEMRLVQVVCNLLTNAAKFTPAGGAVRASLSRRGAVAEVAVSDEGRGIEPALLPHVFTLFVQGEQALDRRVGGLGLGLAIVRMLVGLHGGNVVAESAGRGRGSRFVVHLPCATEPALPAGEAPAAPARHAGRVLVVDDNLDAAQSLGELLRCVGYEVREAHDGPAALAVVAAFVPDVALLDIGLPGMNGYELAAALRADPRLHGLRLIALTGYGQASDRERAVAARFDEHLAKPVALDTLLAAMSRRAAAGS